MIYVHFAIFGMPLIYTTIAITLAAIISKITSKFRKDEVKVRKVAVKAFIYSLLVNTILSYIHFSSDIQYQENTFWTSNTVKLFYCSISFAFMYLFYKNLKALSQN